MATRKRRSPGSPGSPRSPGASAATSSVYLSPDDGVTWNLHEANRRHILVIADGAGVRQNKEVYDNLTAQGYELDIIAAGDRSFAYPDQWQHGNPATRTASGRRSTDDLAGFGHDVGEAIRRRPPSLIICGSRGSQVTIGVVLRHHWQGPFIAMNAGPMTSETRIPRRAFACFLTFGQDYFNTKSPAFTNDRFQALSSPNRRALMLHLPREAHMPSADALQYVLGRYIELAQQRATASQVQAVMWPVQPMIIYELMHGRAMQEVWRY